MRIRTVFVRYNSGVRGHKLLDGSSRETNAYNETGAGRDTTEAEEAAKATREKARIGIIPPRTHANPQSKKGEKAHGNAQRIIDCFVPRGPESLDRRKKGGIGFAGLVGFVGVIHEM